MLFNSISFAIFLPIVFILYWFVANRNLRSQNVLLVIASYFFYACWDWRFLFLLVFSTLLDFYTGEKIALADTKRKKKNWLLLSVLVNLGILGVFKYYNFFAEAFADGLSLLGIKASLGSLNIILPVGISFYTFHGLSYVFDIYNNKIQPERNFINYSLFVSFFPLLVAGPIERATHLLPQLVKSREFNYEKAIDGLRQILWGLFKKMVIADNCAKYVDVVFNNTDGSSSSTLVCGAIFFTIQIYCDFSGYSDIALGTARLFGIELLTNFAFPFFSRDIAEFWRRWHISLSSWFKDYLYIPLGGSSGGKWMSLRNTYIIFLVSGFWHGANWTYIVWGLLHAIYITPSIIFKTNRKNLGIVAEGKKLPTLNEAASMLLTFSLFGFSLIVFRSDSITHAFQYISGMFTKTIFSIPDFTGTGTTSQLLILIVLFFTIEWIGREKKHALAVFGVSWPKALRWGMYYVIVLTIYNYAGPEQQFIYFQF